jgi:uncharacterized membrane protein
VDKEVKIAALSIVALLAVIALMQPIIAVKYPGFSDLAILGPNQNLSGYPRTLNASERFTLYGYIENHQGSAQYYEFAVKLGNRSTSISNTTGASAPLILTRNVVLLNNQSITFPVSLSINNTGNNQRLIFELWSYDISQSQFTYTGVWNEIWVNVTLS